MPLPMHTDHQLGIAETHDPLAGGPSSDGSDGRDVVAVEHLVELGPVGDPAVPRLLGRRSTAGDRPSRVDGDSARTAAASRSIQRRYQLGIAPANGRVTYPGSSTRSAHERHAGLDLEQPDLTAEQTGQQVLLRCRSGVRRARA